MNNVNLIARLTNRPELKKTPNGKSVCSFSVAIERKFKDASGNAITDYIDCTIWNQGAEFLCKWFDKGVRVGLTGELQTRTYTDNEGKSRKVTEVLVSTVEFADGKREANADTNAFAENTNTNAFAKDTSNDFMPIESEGGLPWEQI